MWLPQIKKKKKTFSHSLFKNAIDDIIKNYLDALAGFKLRKSLKECY